MSPEVYFARNADGPVKIGYAIDLERRVSMLATMIPGGVRLLARVGGDRKTEAYFHSLLAEHRIQGEWFAPKEAVLATADDVARNGLARVPEEFWPAPLVEAKQPKRLEEVNDSARQFLLALADGRPATEMIGSTLRRIARTYGLSYRSVKAIWYGECHMMSAGVYLTLKEAFEIRMAEKFTSASRGAIQ